MKVERLGKKKKQDLRKMFEKASHWVLVLEIMLEDWSVWRSGLVLVIMLEERLV